jgi:hypothetical protein
MIFLPYQAAWLALRQRFALDVSIHSGRGFLFSNGNRRIATAMMCSLGDVKVPSHRFLLG